MRLLNDLGLSLLWISDVFGGSLAHSVAQCQRVRRLVVLAFGLGLSLPTWAENSALAAQANAAFFSAQHDQMSLQIGTLSPPLNKAPPRLTLRLLTGPQEQRQGLMGVTQIPQGKGVLMDTRSRTIGGIWMKGMLTHMDLIFLDASGVITGLYENLPPCTSEPCVIYKAPVMDLIIETTPGFIAEHQIQVGQKVYRLP